MCGIAGFISKKSNPKVQKIIDAMTDSLSHRGPNDRGTEIISMGEGEVALGHRRLTIIDLTKRGHQPMLSDDHKAIITYNGEVYNYIELREELKRKGHVFISTSDTEVILKAYLEWGTGCFGKFNGMWAMGIYDQNKNKLVLSRGRFGQKPLYYAKNNNVFVFGSEPKALLAHPAIEKKPNYDKIYRYLAKNYRYVDIDEESFFAGVYQVPKGGYMVVDMNLNIQTEKYWMLDAQTIQKDISDEEAIEKYRTLFIDAVRLRLRSDVPVGCMLSGGLDSTAITAVAYKVLKNPIVTFSGVTGEEKGVYDESEYIDSVIKATNADFHYVKPDPADIFQTVEEMLHFHDEPVCTVTWYSLYLIAKLIEKENIPVILNGHAGDELFAGYWDHYHYYFADLEQEGKTEELAAEIQAWKDNHHRDAEEIDRFHARINAYAAGKDSGMSNFADYSHCFTKEFASAYDRDIRHIPLYEPLLQNRLESELLFETIPASLRPEDRNTMAFSLESRSPFLDYRLVEFCFTLPSHMKIRNGLCKWIHREAMKGILPENVRTRKDKAGFIAPADEWFRTINKDQIQDMIDSEELDRRGIFNKEEIQRSFDEHCAGEKNHQMFLWQLINLELWFRKNFDDVNEGREDEGSGFHFTSIGRKV